VCKAILVDWPGRILRAACGVIASLAVVIYTLVLVPAIVLLSVRSRRDADAVAILWSRLVLWTSFVRVESVGRARVPRGGSCVLVANHESYLDICGLINALGAFPRFVAKKELLRVPVVGQGIVALKQIVIDRDDPEGAKEAIERAMRALPDGVQVCFFAEGTRSATGRIGPFKKGAVALALQTGLPLVPVSIRGTRELMPKGSPIVYPGGTIHVVFGEPIATAGMSFDQRDALTAEVRDAVIRGYDQAR
jgi:1-acyl-sn-glycerol-3-phosphate acyltransferase